MSTWTRDELDRIGTMEEIQIAALRQDGSLRRPVTIWVVRVGDELYVRSARGQAGAWYQGTRARHAGRIWAGRKEIEVGFVDEADPDINDQIDAAYHTKYRRLAQYVPPVVSSESRTTTMKLVPRPPAGE